MIKKKCELMNNIYFNINVDCLLFFTQHNIYIYLIYIYILYKIYNINTFLYNQTNKFLKNNLFLINY